MRQGRFWMLLGISAFVSSANVQAQVRWSTPPPSVVRVETNRPALKNDSGFSPENIGLISRASALIDKKVQDANARTVGRLRDILVDLPQGRVPGALMEYDNREVFVPANQFFPVSEDRVVVTAPGSALKNAPVMQPTAGVVNAQTIQSAYQHFGVAPPAGLAPAAGMWASKILNQPVIDSHGEALGKVQNVVVDVPKGEAVYLVVQPSSGGNDVYAVPPQLVDPTSNASTIRLKTDRNRFLAGPKVSREFWTEMSLPQFAKTVYGYYGFSDTSSSYSRTQPRTGTAQLAPTGRSDEEIRQAFLGQLVHDSPMTLANARDLNIVVSNGRISLKGDVSSESKRRDIVSAAERVVGPGNVQDQLRVK